MIAWERLEDLQSVGACEVAEGTTLARLELQWSGAYFRELWKWVMIMCACAHVSTCTFCISI